MNTDPKIELAEEKISKLVRRFAIPAVISGLIGALYNIADQIFIGQKIGMLGNAATMISFPMITICIGLSLMLGGGTSNMFSLSLGSGDEKKAGLSIGNGLTSLFLCSLIIVASVAIFCTPLLYAFGATENIIPMARTYILINGCGAPFFMLSFGLSLIIRADSSPKYSMFTLISGSVLNFILDPIFIFGFNWGIAGAAWASVLSQVFSFSLGLYYILFRFQSVKLNFSYFTKLKKRIIGRICVLGATPMLAHISMMIVQIVLNNALSYYGGQSVYGGDIPLAVAGVIGKCNFIFMSINLGVIQGSQPIIGYNYGAMNYKRVKKTLFLIIKTVGIINIFTFISFHLFPREIISIFGSGSEMYYQFAEKYFKIFMFMVLVNGFEPVVGNFYSAIGKPIYGIIATLSRRLLFLIPLVFILSSKYGIDGILYSAPIADSLAFLITGSFLFMAVIRLRKQEQSITSNSQVL
ncbi:MAG: MATE family efflux transporter [Bacteroidales bacterium]